VAHGGIVGERRARRKRRVPRPAGHGRAAAVALANALVLGARWRARPARAADLRLGAAGDVNPPVA
jgi:hypothetical protein